MVVPMKTVKQIADEYGVSVQAIYKRLKPFKPDFKPSLKVVESGITYITPDGETYFNKALNQGLNQVKPGLKQNNS